MSPVLIGVAVLIAALLLVLVVRSFSGGTQRNELLESQMSDLRRDLQTLAAAQAKSSGEVAAIGQTVNQRLDSVSKSLADNVTAAANIAAHSQTSMQGELRSTREQIIAIQKQLGEVQQAGRELSSATQTLQSILGGAKTRGSLGEITLEGLLQDALPSAHYVTQYRFGTGEIADAVIYLRDGKLLAVDSKFPLEAFRRIASEGEEARRAFAVAVKFHADCIARKYILPEEDTLDVALMFVPSESVYYELVMTADSKGEPLDLYCRNKRVFPVSPNTLYAQLCVISMGLRGMQLEENARRLYASLAGVQKQFDTFGDVFERLGNHLKNAQASYAEADKRLEKTQNTFENLLSADAADSPLENPQGLLPLTDPEEERERKKSAQGA
jgi:DNA recombination protein RmuC